MKQKNTLYIGLATIILLLIPLIGMQFSNQVNWTLSDFVIMGALLFITGTLIDIAMRKMPRHRFIAAFVIVFLFVWLWAELAVGIFTNWGS